MAKRKYTMSRAAQQQRAANGKRLAASLDNSYFAFIGRRGGRRAQYNQLMRLAQTWQFSQAQIAESKVSERRRAELVAEMREHYRQQAIEKYHDYTGNRIMLELFFQEGG